MTWVRGFFRLWVALSIVWSVLFLSLSALPTNAKDLALQCNVFGLSYLQNSGDIKVGQTFFEKNSAVNQ